MSKVSRVDRSEPVRKQRVPVASNRAPLAYKGLDKDNFSYRWVIEKDDRIATPYSKIFFSKDLSIF